MGKEVETRVRVGRKALHTKVLLETSEIIVRGPTSRKVPFGDMKDLGVNAGELRFTAAGEAFSIELGKEAEKWLDAIRNPRTRTQKLGVRPGMRVCALGAVEQDAFEEIGEVTGTLPSRRLSADLDLVLLFAPDPDDLDRLREIEPRLAPKGAVWVLWPKGRKDFAHEDVVGAAKRAGLVQTKSMGFSPTNTGLRLTRPAKK